MTVATSASAAVSQSSNTLGAGAPLTFSGAIEPDPNTGLVVENPFGPSLGCMTGMEQFCEFVNFIATATGTVTFVFTSANPNNLMDAAVHCNGELMARATAMTDPGDGSDTQEFAILSGDQCQIRISLFLALNPEDLANPAGFSGSLTLTIAGAAVVQEGRVQGNGQVIDPKMTFATNARKDSPARGKVRFVNKNTDCKFLSDKDGITSLVFTTFVENGMQVKRADIDGFGRVKLGNGSFGPRVSFHATLEDRGKPGAGVDRFGIDQCGGSPQPVPILKGEIRIRLDVDDD